MLWGFFKKLVIADRLALYVDSIYNHVEAFKGGAFLIATILFSFQIYCDFSGYSDIARGSANLFGIHLMENFKSPYLSSSLKEFWNRWHISLSSWFRDYVYISMGGNRVGKWKHYRNLMATFLFSGLWHGASWTFLVWGGLHGLGQIIENMFYAKRKRGCPRFVAALVVFAFTNFAWIFFRANSLSNAIYIIRNTFTGISRPITYLKLGFHDIGINRYMLCYLLILLVLLLIFDYVSLKSDLIEAVSKLPLIVRWGIYYSMAIIIIAGGVYTSNRFIYFQF